MFDRRKVKVTSHIVGAAVEKDPTLAKETVQRGHEPSGLVHALRAYLK
jgi:hypothetical protein